MRSLWLDRPRDPVVDALPPDDRFDDLVVGAGLTGLTTALLLARAGRRVGVLDAREPGGLTTGHTTAKVTLLQGTKLSKMARAHSRPVLEAYLDANREGQQWLLRFCEEHDVPVQRREAITYAASEEELPKVRAEHDAALGLGLPVTWADDLEVPFPLHGATVLPDQVQLDPIDLVDALVAQVRSHGGSVHAHLHVRDVRREGGVCAVELDDGRELRAENVVLATGMPILDRTFAFAQLEPSRSYLLAFTGAEPPPGMYISAGSPSRSMRQVPTSSGSVLLVGGNGHTVGRSPSEARAVRELSSWARGWFPDAVQTHAWSAQDYSAPGGGLPQVGTAPFSDGHIHFASGFDKWGMTNGIAAGLAMVGAILGERPHWARHLEPPDLSARTLAGLLTLNAKVGAYLVGGHLRALSRPLPPAAADDGGQVGRAGVLPGAQTDVDGRTCRLRAVCTHLGGPLSWNDAENTWDCTLHGSRFSPTGEVIEGPAVRPLARLDEAEANG